MQEEMLYEFLMSLFLLKGALRAQQNRTLCNPIFDFPVDKRDRRVHNTWVGSYSSKNEFLMDSIEKKEDLAYIKTQQRWMSGLSDLQFLSTWKEGILVICEFLNLVIVIY